MLTSLYTKLAGIAAVAVTILVLVVMLHTRGLRIAALTSQLAGAQAANQSYAADVAEQNKKIGDLLQAEQDLESQVASATAKLNAATANRLSVVKATKVSPKCDDSLNWLRAQAPSLSHLPVAPVK